MSTLDWAVLIATQIFIAAYGMWMGRGSKDIRGYLLSDKSTPWFTIGLSIMATQASAITFLSTPGQAYGDGMRFLHFYLGMPLAMVALSIVAVPLYHRLNVYTAYEYLEQRFGVEMRSLTAFLFLTQRSLAAGISIYAPAIILSKVLGWSVDVLSVAIGLLVVLYTVTGGSKAVSYTQKQQMFIILVGMMIAGYLVVHLMPEGVGFSDAVQVAGKMGKLEVIDFSFNLSDRYNIWTGVIGGFFLALSYFGTDQSQVQRYLGGKSVGESRMGLLMNGMLKIPMQFLILLLGALLFVFYLFSHSPVYFNSAEREAVYGKAAGTELKALEAQHEANEALKRQEALALVGALRQGDEAQVAHAQAALLQRMEEEKAIRDKAISLVKSTENQKDIEKARAKDLDYVFISFVTKYMPQGLVGLLISVIIAAAMSSASSELNALATTTMIDVYKRSLVKERGDHHYLKASKWLTLGWGIFAIAFTQIADKLENLIQAVNTIGSWVYGVILGIFLVAFFLKNVGSKATFMAALLAQALVMACYFTDAVPYLWFNVIGCLPLLAMAYIFQKIIDRQAAS